LKAEDLHLISNHLQKVETWVEEHGYKGYDPFDGLLSFLRPLAFRNLFAERILQQAVRQCPVNLRPLLGVKAQESPIARGYMAWGYLRRYTLTKDPHYRRKAVECLDWLRNNKSPHYENYSWGNDFDYVSRGGCIPKFEPTIVWTSLIGQVFLDAYEIFDDDHYLNIAGGICDWIMDLPREKTAAGTCLSYVAGEQLSIHNSNMLGAAMLARTAKFTGRTDALRIAEDAMEYSCARQQPDGSWYYGDDIKYHWIDNFHTAYNLESLKCYTENTGDKTYENNLKLGFQFFKGHFFKKNGMPKYYYNRTYPVDIQCAAQAIETLADFFKYDDSSLTSALQVAKWVIKNMYGEKGCFHYRLYPLNFKVKIPMIHWGQATTYKAFAGLMSRMS